ncbi:MAG: hypothetical protein ACE5JX_06205 [Acidobacteriota bacterium]
MKRLPICCRFCCLFFLSSLSLTSGPLRASSIRHLASLGPGGGGGVFSAVFHNTTPDIILVAQDVGGVYKTTDGGRSWSHVNNRGLLRPDLSEDATFVDELVAHPGDNSRFFSCTQSGLFRSDDLGESWSLVIPPAGASSPEVPVAWVAFSPRDPSLGLAGTGSWHEPEEGFGLYRTLDGGFTFSLLEQSGIPGDATISSIVFDPDDGTVYASTTSGLYTSIDSGNTFTPVGFAFRHERGEWIGIGGSGSGKTFWYILYTLGDDGDPSSRSGGIYRSTDAVTWTEIAGAPTVSDPECNEILRTMGARAHPTDPSILYVNFRTDGGQGGLYRWDGSWTDLTAAFVDETWAAGSGFSPIAPECVSLNTANPDLILSCNEEALLVSSDGGANWRQLSTRQVGPGRWAGTGAEVVVTYDLAGSGDTLYVAFEDIGFWRSDDRGASWRQLLWPGAKPDTIRPDGATEIFVHPQDPNRFYVFLGSFSNDLREGDVRPEIHKSLDGGTSSTVEVSPPAPAGPLGRGAMSVVWGETPDQDTLYAAFHGDTLYKSTNGGASWVEVSAGFSPQDKRLIFRIVVDPSQPNTVYAGLNTDFGAFSGKGGIYRSTDGGSNWSRLEGYPFQDVIWLGFAGSPRRLFAGGWTGGEGSLQVSDDGTTFGQVLSQPFVTALADAPGSPGTLYSVSSSNFVRGTNQEAGIYRSADNGTTWRRLEGTPQHSRTWNILILPDQPNILYLASDGDGILAMEFDDLKRHFAQFGDGGGISSTLTLINPSSSQTASGTVSFFDSEGQPLSVEINGSVENGRFDFDLAARGAGFFTTGNTGSSPSAGSVQVEASIPLAGTILFSSANGVAGVGAVRPSSRQFLMPVDNNVTTGTRTGVALSNQGTLDLDVSVTLRHTDGTALDNGSTVISLPARNQLAQFLEEIFSGRDFSTFRGCSKPNRRSRLPEWRFEQARGSSPPCP